MTSMLSSILGEKRARPESPSPTTDGKSQTLGEDALASITSELKIFLRSELNDKLQAALADALVPFKLEIQQQIGEILAPLHTQIAAFVETMEAKVEAKLDNKLLEVQEIVRAGYEDLDNKFSKCDSSPDALERKFRSPNAILFGVEESVGEKTLNEVTSFLNCEIHEAARLGKFVAGAPRARPVLIRFHSTADKHAAYKKSKDLRRRFHVSMDDDLTPKQRAARAALQPQATALRNQGWITFWRGESLFKVKGQGPPFKVLPGVFAAPPSASPAPTPSAPPATGPGPSSRAQGPSA